MASTNMNSRNKAVHTALDPDLDTIDVPASLIGICCRGRHAWCGRSLRPPRSRRERRAQCGDEGLHGSLLRERCQTICRDARKINRWPARTIKLSFRKLNSILCEQVGRELKPRLEHPRPRVPSTVAFRAGRASLNSTSLVMNSRPIARSADQPTAGASRPTGPELGGTGGGLNAAWRVSLSNAR